MSTARSQACGSARSLIQPCSSHSWMAPTSSGTEIAHPSIVRNAARLSFTTSIAIFHSGTGRILEVANSSRVSILGSEAMIGICPRSNILNVQFCSDQAEKREYRPLRCRVRHDLHAHCHPSAGRSGG
jgi:hypothetical protein